jgi:hypothetical protein
MSRRPSRPYVDRGMPGLLRYQKGGILPLVCEPPILRPRMLKLHEIQRHNSLEPELQETHRILLRWSEGGGNGLKNPEADIRETHYDPLPPDLQEKVDDIVDGSPWAPLIVKRYRSSLDMDKIAIELDVSRTKLYADLRAALWYFRGRLEAARVHG